MRSRSYCLGIFHSLVECHPCASMESMELSWRFDGSGPAGRRFSGTAARKRPCNPTARRNCPWATRPIRDALPVVLAAFNESTCRLRSSVSRCLAPSSCESLAHCMGHVFVNRRYERAHGSDLSTASTRGLKCVARISSRLVRAVTWLFTLATSCRSPSTRGASHTRPHFISHDCLDFDRDGKMSICF